MLSEKRVADGKLTFTPEILKWGQSPLPIWTIILKTSRVHMSLKRCSTFILLSAVVIPSMAYATSYGTPLPSVPTDSFPSQLLLQVAIGFYLAAIVLNSIASVRHNRSVATTGWLIGLFGVVVHLTAFLLRWEESYAVGYGQFPLYLSYECAIVFSLALAVVGFYLQRKSFQPTTATLMLIIVVAMMIWAKTTLFTGIYALFDPDSPPYNIDQYMLIHRLYLIKNAIKITCYTVLITAGYVSVLIAISRVAERLFLKSSLHESAPLFFAINKKAIISGMFLLAVYTGISMYWAQIAWGVYWSWDPEETLLLFLNITCAIILLRNSITGWHTLSAARRSITGLIVMIGLHRVINFILH